MDERVLKAANRLAAENIIYPIYIGDEQKIKRFAASEHIHLENYEVICPHTYGNFNLLITEFMKRRNKHITEKAAARLLTKPVYFGTMLVYLGIADGIVSGATHTTSE